MKLLRVLRGLFAFLVIPALGYMFGATIFIHFYDKIETGDLAKAEYIAVAKSCEERGPVTVRGFGTWWECQAEVTRPASGDTRTFTTRGFLKPEHIGEQVAVGTVRRGSEIVPEERPYQGLGGFLLFPFGILWLFVLAYTANPLLRKHIDRAKTRAVQAPPTQEAERETQAEVSHEVYVWGGPRRWLRGPWLYLPFVVGVLVALNFRELAFTSRTPSAMVVFVVACAVPLLIIGNGVRRLVFSPAVTISPEGVAWGRNKKLSWVEVHHVHLSDRNVLMIQPRLGGGVRIGRFGDEQATRIHVAIGHFCPVPYTREDVNRSVESTTDNRR